jgi:hypothetical protein
LFAALSHDVPERGDHTKKSAPKQGLLNDGKILTEAKYDNIINALNSGSENRHFQKPTEELNFFREELNFVREQLNYPYTISVHEQ